MRRPRRRRAVVADWSVVSPAGQAMLRAVDAKLTDRRTRCCSGGLRSGSGPPPFATPRRARGRVCADTVGSASSVGRCGGERRSGARAGLGPEHDRPREAESAEGDRDAIPATRAPAGAKLVVWPAGVSTCCVYALPTAGTGSSAKHEGERLVRPAGVGVRALEPQAAPGDSIGRGLGQSRRHRRPPRRVRRSNGRRGHLLPPHVLALAGRWSGAGPGVVAATAPVIAVRERSAAHRRRLARDLCRSRGRRRPLLPRRPSAQKAPSSVAVRPARPGCAPLQSGAGPARSPRSAPMPNPVARRAAWPRSHASLGAGGGGTSALWGSSTDVTRAGRQSIPARW
jgi:hypothetical protein